MKKMPEKTLGEYAREVENFLKKNRDLLTVKDYKLFSNIKKQLDIADSKNNCKKFNFLQLLKYFRLVYNLNDFFKLSELIENIRDNF
jgi:hypothetical protein